jgi:hypothetical protein
MAREMLMFRSLFGSIKIDRATLPPPLEYWVPIMAVAGGHELVGNALVPPGEGGRLTDLRGESLGPREVGAHA